MRNWSWSWRFGGKECNSFYMISWMHYFPLALYVHTYIFICVCRTYIDMHLGVFCILNYFYVLRYIHYLKYACHVLWRHYSFPKSFHDHFERQLLHTTSDVWHLIMKYNDKPGPIQCKYAHHKWRHSFLCHL